MYGAEAAKSERYFGLSSSVKNVCIGCLRRGRADLSSCLKPRPDMRPTWSHDSATPVAGWLLHHPLTRHSFRARPRARSSCVACKEPGRALAGDGEIHEVQSNEGISHEKAWQELMEQIHGLEAKSCANRCPLIEQGSKILQKSRRKSWHGNPAITPSRPRGKNEAFSNAAEIEEDSVRGADLTSESPCRSSSRPVSHTHAETCSQRTRTWSKAGPAARPPPPHRPAAPSCITGVARSFAAALRAVAIW